MTFQSMPVCSEKNACSASVAPISEHHRRHRRARRRPGGSSRWRSARRRRRTTATAVQASVRHAAPSIRSSSGVQGDRAEHAPRRRRRPRPAGCACGPSPRRPPATVAPRSTTGSSRCSRGSSVGARYVPQRGAGTRPRPARRSPGPAPGRPGSSGDRPGAGPGCPAGRVTGGPRSSTTISPGRSLPGEQPGRLDRRGVDGDRWGRRRAGPERARRLLGGFRARATARRPVFPAHLPSP